MKVEVSSLYLHCSVYPQEELISLERIVLLVLRFNLHPPMYICIIDEILYEWDRYLPV